MGFFGFVKHVVMVVNNVIMVFKYRSFRFMSVLMFFNISRLYFVIMVKTTTKLIMFIKFIWIVGAFRIINANEVDFWN
jgi:hypothetical protein